jgi:hypothetical protein
MTMPYFSLSHFLAMAPAPTMGAVSRADELDDLLLQYRAQLEGG